jgi:hypothetical protein
MTKPTKLPVGTRLALELAGTSETADSQLTLIHWQLAYRTMLCVEESLSFKWAEVGENSSLASHYILDIKTLKDSVFSSIYL